MGEKDVIDAINRLVESNATMAQVYADLAKSNMLLAEEEREKLDIVHQVVITGDPKNNVPSMLDVQRTHSRALANASKGAWILVGAVLVGVPAAVWATVTHVLAGQ